MLLALLLCGLDGLRTDLEAATPTACAACANRRMAIGPTGPRLGDADDVSTQCRFIGSLLTDAGHIQRHKTELHAYQVTCTVRASTAGVVSEW